MTPRTLILSLALAATALSACARADTLSKQLNGWIERANVSAAAVARIHDGAIAEVALAGESAPGVALRRDTVFNVASLAKPVFAMLCLKLVAAGELDLDESLAAYWVDPDIADDPRHRQLTARLVLSHQTGLPNWRGDRQLAFNFDPGTRHDYSGEGFEYLRRAIEAKTGEDLPTLMQRHVTGPAGMRDSHFGWNEGLAGRIATGYDESGESHAVDNLSYRGPAAASSLFTTIDDYARFALWVIDGAGLPKSLLHEMAQSQARHPNPAEFFGLGWRLVDADGATVLSHDGREAGTRTQVFVLPQSRQALVILSNSNHGELIVKPITEAALDVGAALMQAVARDTWTFVRSVPLEQVGGMLQFIARSPSFTAKLLHAANTVAAHAGQPAAVAAADQAIQQFAQAMARGERSSDDALALFQPLLAKDGEVVRVREQLDAGQARDWRAALSD